MVRQQFNGFEELSHDIERVFDSVLGRTLGSVLRGGGEQSFSPALDVSESEEAFEVCIDLPGVQPEHVNLEVLDGQLVISGERKPPQDVAQANRIRTERCTGEFRRQVPLPVGIDVEKIDAQHALGVLTITAAKVAPKQPTKIPIRNAE